MYLNANQTLKIKFVYFEKASFVWYLGPFVRRVLSMPDSIFFKLSKIVHLLVWAWLKFGILKIKFRFINYEVESAVL